LLADSEVVASDLTLIECDRVIIRAVAVKQLTEADAADCRARLVDAAAAWYVMRVSPEIVERARLPFPVELVRSLDAIHLASALVARAGFAGLEILSLDESIRGAARALGLPAQPSALEA
jgi:hypothetical protein